MQIHAGFEAAGGLRSASTALLLGCYSELALNANGGYTAPVSAFKGSRFGPFIRVTSKKTLRDTNVPF